MASPKTRANMARFAAAAVFAAGASLAIVGTASADGISPADAEEPPSGTIGIPGDVLGGSVSIGGSVSVGGAAAGGEEAAAGGEEAAAGGEEAAAGGEEAAGGNGNQGVSQGGTDGGLDPDNQGGGGPIEQEPPTEDITEETPSPAGDQGELAETGSSTNQTLLIIGAATMIAGGVGFRYLPRLITKGVTTA